INMKKRTIALLLVMCSVLSLCTGCLWKNDKEHKKEKAKQEAEEDLEEYNQDYSGLSFNADGWNYDKEHHVYWQIQVPYCTSPDASAYETMAVYVPAAYMDAEKNEDGTYSCTVNEEKTLNGYTAQTAPIVFPVNTEEYASVESPAEYKYKEAAKFLKQGFVYVCIGMRGKENGQNEDGTTYSGGAPWSVTDMKAAVRFYRFNKEALPGDTEQIYCYGTGAGGTLAAILGASGNSDLYTPYLTEIGAAIHDEEGKEISDEISGVMAWCPSGSLDYGNEAYEWNLGQYYDEDTRKEGTWTQKFAEDMANIYGEYINALKLKDEQGNVLSLKKGGDGIYRQGTYCDYLISVIEESLNRFLENTTFPHEDYASAEDYIAYLNRAEEWVKYDEKTNTAKIESIEAFVKYCKSAERPVGAFDDLNRSSVENDLFGTEGSEALHFDSTMSYLLQEYSFDYSRLKNWDDSLTASYSADMEVKDSLDNSLGVRQSMYNPMYYISPYYEGYNTSAVAKYWRINSGVGQSESLLSAEVNLFLALKDVEDVKDVSFTEVWGQDYSMAEESGKGIGNFIAWVKECSTK
ncbi:MAG: hypothetical protein ACI4S2_15050, partial [Lachnospiraceae bacterium]